MKSVAAILVALCLVHLRDVGATVKVLRKSLNVTERRLAFWTESYTDEHLTYALCDDKHLQGDEIKCTVIREKEPYGNDSYSCDVTLKRHHFAHNKKRFPDISVYPFGQKYAAVTLWEGTHLNFTIVQMDSCKVNAAAIFTLRPLDKKFVKVVDHSDSIDVFFVDVFEVWCWDKVCKFTLDVDGQVIDRVPLPSIIKYTSSDKVAPVAALDNGPSGNGYYYLREDGNDVIHMLVKPDETEISLTRHPKLSGMVFVSNKNKLLGVCHRAGNDFECSQYDFDGNLKHHITTSIDDKDRMYAQIYNLPNGGYYVVSIECNKRPQGHCMSFNRFFIERVDANGTKTGSIIFQGFDNSLRFEAFSSLFYENDAKEVCLSLVAMLEKEGDADRSELTANCFTDADFAK